MILSRTVNSVGSSFNFQTETKHKSYRYVAHETSWSGVYVMKVQFNVNLERPLFAYFNLLNAFLSFFRSFCRR